MKLTQSAKNREVRKDTLLARVANSATVTSSLFYRWTMCILFILKSYKLWETDAWHD